MCYSKVSVYKEIMYYKIKPRIGYWDVHDIISPKAHSYQSEADISLWECLLPEHVKQEPRISPV